MNHIIYFDNFYTTLGLYVYLRSRGIYSLGTVRSDRLPNSWLSTDLALNAKKVVRGNIKEYVGNALGIGMTSVLWNDTKPVRLLSTYVASKPFTSKDVNAQSKKSHSMGQEAKEAFWGWLCPQIIRKYNRHMKGVDLMDGLLGRYHIRMKTRKWTNRIFFHLIDVVNSYI